MKRLLFVDDETAVLDALRDRLRKQRREWVMVFARGGEEALAECARGAFDVVVSDMCMPGMDGATLLGLIKERYPSTIRVVLSGHAEREAVLRALSVAHQYLSKPCDAEILRGTLARACAIRDMMTDAALRGIVGGIEKVPSTPAIYAELTRELARAAPSLDAIVEIVERDPGMCLKLLQLVNSPFFGSQCRATSMRDAVKQLGMDLVKLVVLAAEIFAAAEGPDGSSAAAVCVVQQHSLKVARIAREIAPPCGQNDAFVAGMLHDIGAFVLEMADEQESLAIRREARDRGRSLFSLEQERLGITHAEVGAYLLGTWGVPLSIVEPVAGHHVPGRFGGSSIDTTMAVHVAEALVTEADDKGDAAAHLDEEHLERLGLLDRVPAWRAIARRVLD